MRHGACLGLGLAACGTNETRAYEKLRNELFKDEAETGEAAATAMGLVMAGSLNDAVFYEMHNYATETQHDKIKWGLRTGMALLALGLKEKAEVGYSSG